MTDNSNFKRSVRARASKTGESYTASLLHFRQVNDQKPMPQVKRVRLAVAQTIVREDPRNSVELRESGLEMRRLMREAHGAGARLIQFPEGATCFPQKRILSITGPENVGPSDWTRFEWAVLREELNAIARLARELKLWTIFGSVHPLSQPHRPHNSLYVVSDRGELATRYDERMLSNTKVSFMYTPGSVPVTFEVDGLRFGCSLGMESHFPEIFIEYERLGADCVLFSTAGGVPADGSAFAKEAQGHAATNSYWVGFSVPAQHGNISPSGIITPTGGWAARCPQDGTPSMVLVDIDNHPGNPARPWRRIARTGIYEPYMVQNDQRSDDRGTF